MSTQRLVAAAILASAILPYHARAELEIAHRTRCEVRISGEITAADALKLVGSDCPDPFVILYNSPGGDVRAGMNIGRWVRENQAPTSVEQKQYCHSTCALVFIAGVERFNLGVIGLHSPFCQHA